MHTRESARHGPGEPGQGTSLGSPSQGHSFLCSRLLSPPGSRVSCADTAGRSATSDASNQHHCPVASAGRPGRPAPAGPVVDGLWASSPAASLLSRTHILSGRAWNVLEAPGVSAPATPAPALLSVSG